MASVKVNGKVREVPDGIFLPQLLEIEGVQPRLVVVELNGAVVFPESWGQTEINDGDEIEIASFVGGG